MNRIYQGRVVKVEIRENDEWIELSNGLSILWHHHELFQDAVNYYLVALASMASDPESPVGKLKRRMVDCWDDFTRKGEFRHGLKRSIARTLGVSNPGTFTLPDALAHILDGNTVDPVVLQLAVNLVAEKCKGDSGVQQNGRTYWPRLCDIYYKSSWDFDAKAKFSTSGKDRLVAMLNSADPVQAIIAVSGEMMMEWAGVKTQTGKYFTDKDAAGEIQKAILHFQNLPKKDQKPTLLKYLDSIGDLKTRLCRYLAAVDNLKEPRIEKNNRTDLNRKNAYILLKFFPDEFTIGLMKTVPPFGGEVPTTSPKGKKVMDSTIAYDQFGDDPIKLARGARGYVFRSFTSLAIFAPASVWKAFNIEAFKEALKTVNQFNQKTVERRKEETKIQSLLNWMDGKTNKRPQTEEESSEEEAIGVLGGDPRWLKLQDLLKELKVSNELSEGEALDYGLYPRTIRGFKVLRQEWQKILDKHADAVHTVVRAKLKLKLDNYQTVHRDEIGSATLFNKLIEPENWKIWCLPEGAQVDAARKNRWSQNVISDSVIYYEAKRDLSDLREPINFTPADPRLSRRLCNLSDLGSWPRKVKGKIAGTKGEFGHDQGGSFACRVPLAVKNAKSNLWEKCAIRIGYTAPRLLRDGLRQDSADEHLDATSYLPPMAIPLVDVNTPDPQDFLTCALQLMPDWDKDGIIRILLNFPLDVTVDAIRQANPKSTRWERQFLYANDKNTMLLWPSPEDKQKATWCNDRSSFQSLAVDLGQRTAGAVALIDVTPSKPSKGYPREIGQAGDVTWYARRIGTELLRLPGEDIRVWRDGKWQVELSGSCGRMPTEAETTQARDLCQAFGQDPNELLAEQLSFPKQNDKLIVAARRAQSRLARLNRWLWMLSEENKHAAILNVIKEYDEYKNLLEFHLLTRIREDEAKLRDKISDLLLKLTNRILPLRGRQWQFIRHPETGVHQKKPSFLLCQTQKGSDTTEKKICGQRGLSFARIEQLEELRKRWQSLNRTLMRDPGTKPESARQMRDNQVPDPCPDILRRLDAMREQRVNQTAHLIVASALGLRLKKHNTTPVERTRHDIHGEYERIPGRSPVAFIVMEDLSRYLASQGRAPSENSRLMKWAHRAVIAKVKMLCEPFGINVAEVPAAFSSRFCSATGTPGFRAVEITAAARNRFPWKNLLAEATSDKPSKDAVACAELFKLLDVNHGVALLAPKAGGPVFVPICDGAPTTQADINAAFNIGLRALAAPEQFHVHQRIRAEKDKGGGHWIAKGKSKLDKIRFGKGELIVYEPDETERKEVASKSVINFFVDVRRIAVFDCAHFKDANFPQMLATNKGLWGSVKDAQWSRCLKLNLRRLKKNKALPDLMDEIPM